MILFRLQLFGGLSIAPLRGALTSDVATRRYALSLLALMAVAGDNGMSRDRVMALLWPEADEAHARNNLKQLVFAIRHGLSLDIIDGGGPMLQLESDVMRADVEDFVRAKESGDLERAVELYAGPFLDGFHVPHLSEFERWVEAQRCLFARRFALALETLARRAGAMGDMHGAVRWWRRLAGHDPINSAFTVGLIDALADAGEPLGALKHFAEHERAIREEFGIDPDSNVRLAAERVRKCLTHPHVVFAVEERRDALLTGAVAPMLARGL